MPVEVHEHFDADGNLTGTTTVTRESPWDDESRARVLALAEYESSLCGCGCGQPLVSAMDPSQPWLVDKYVCYAERAKRKVARADAEKAQAQKLPDGWSDGTFYYVKPAQPRD